MKSKFKIVDRLLNKQVSSWVFLRERVSFKKSGKKRCYPCITVSRETGSGGRLVAKLVAKELKFKYYDKKIVELIVKRTKKRKELIKFLDEKSLSFVEETIGALFGAKMLSSSTYFRHLVEVITVVACKQNCVILGRGGNFILPLEKTLRIRIIAPLKTRIENSMKFENNAKAKAKSEISKIHFNRKDFIKRYFRKNISNANYYDLVINTENLTAEQAAAVIVNAFRKKFIK